MNFISNLAARYKFYFTFSEQDIPLVNKRRNNYLFISLLIVLAVPAVCLLYSIMEKTGEDDYKFYSIYIIGALINLLFLKLIQAVFKSNETAKSIPTYFFNLCYLAFNVWNLYDKGFFHTSYLNFAIHAVLCCLLLDTDPIIWTVSIVATDLSFGIFENDALRYLNISLFSITVCVLNWWKRYSRVQTFRFTNMLNSERKKNEDLLLNMFPRKIIDELKLNGKTVPEKFENTSILFTDFAGFTNTSKDLSPETVISELNDIFTAFDELSEKHNCTRIKTIGDSYFAVCGVPEPNADHAKHIVFFAIDMVNYLKKRNETSAIKWNMRVGINSGEVTAGIVGTKKYLYDVFGDAVNTASRMESNSQPMQINVSEATRNLLTDNFKFIERPLIEVKGKGPMKMYFVDLNDGLTAEN